jgi:hypothetical protein
MPRLHCARARANHQSLHCSSAARNSRSGRTSIPSSVRWGHAGSDLDGRRPRPVFQPRRPDADVGIPLGSAAEPGGDEFPRLRLGNRARMTGRRGQVAEYEPARHDHPSIVIGGGDTVGADRTQHEHRQQCILHGRKVQTEDSRSSGGRGPVNEDVDRRRSVSAGRGAYGDGGEHGGRHEARSIPHAIGPLPARLRLAETRRSIGPARPEGHTATGTYVVFYGKAIARRNQHFWKADQSAMPFMVDSGKNERTA